MGWVASGMKVGLGELDEDLGGNPVLTPLSFAHFIALSVLFQTSGTESMMSLREVCILEWVIVLTFCLALVFSGTSGQ